MTAPLPGRLVELPVPVVIVTHAGPTERTQRCTASPAATEQAAPVVVVNKSGGPPCKRQ